MSECWDGSVPLLATDVSAHGLWLEADYPLDVGSELTISFIPPHWSEPAPFRARARVARVGLMRRRTDRGRGGMGLCFEELHADQSERLLSALQALPPLPPTAAMTRILRVQACASLSSASSCR